MKLDIFFMRHSKGILNSGIKKKLSFTIILYNIYYYLGLYLFI